MLYSYRKQFGFSPGAQDYVFRQEWSLPRFRILSPGVPARQYFKPISMNPGYQYQSVPQSGIGGVITGGIVFQPLVNNGS